MKLFRLAAFSAILTLGTLCAVFFASSCNVDSCKGVVCQNIGVCQKDGSCKCTGNYTGTHCETATITGTWKGVDYIRYESGALDSAMQSVTIAFSALTNRMDINIAGRHAGLSFTGTLDNYGGTITYTDTVTTPAGIDTLTGSLYLYGGGLRHDYQTTRYAAANSFYQASGTYTKQ